MPRRFRNRLLAAPIALLALGLASCFQDVGDCPTCPAVDSGRIDILLPQTGQVDSVHATIDGGARVTVRRNQRFSFVNLKEGRHVVTITRWFFIDEVLSSRAQTLEIVLARGETRTIVFHNDFPLVAYAPPPGASPALAAARPSPRWASVPSPKSCARQASHRGPWLRCSSSKYRKGIRLVGDALPEPTLTRRSCTRLRRRDTSA